MTTKLPEAIKWLERPLQGLAFWIGYQQSMFHGRDLVEGALAAEACNLIHTNLDSNFVLIAERMYKNLVPDNIHNREKFGQIRADLVVCKKVVKSAGKDRNISSHVELVFEIKRGSAPDDKIDDDLVRLYDFLVAKNTNARAFLIVISEGNFLCRFGKKDKAKRGRNDVPNCNGYFHVRRALKAGASFDKIENANYVYLVEVFK